MSSGQFEAVYRTHSDKVYSFICDRLDERLHLSRTADGEWPGTVRMHAEDLTIEVWLMAYRRRDEFQTPGAVVEMVCRNAAWLCDGP
jgi:hypothetical protein